MRFPRLNRSPEKLERLRALSLFSTLDARELRIVDSLLHEREYVAGEVIFDEGEEGQAIYLVFEGRVLICRQGEPADGRIAEMGPGTFFGDLALLDNAPRSAQARAETDCRLGVFFRTDFHDMLETNAATASKLALQLARHIGARLRERARGVPTEQYL